MKKILPLLLLLACLFTLSACKKKTPVLFDPASRDTVSADTGFCLTVSESYALNMLRASLPSDTPFTVDGLDFSDDSTMTISGQVNLRALGEENNMPFHTLYPTTIAFSTRGQLTYTKESGVTLTPLSLEILSFEIPLDVLPESLYQPYQEKINGYLSELPMTLTELSLTNDAIVIIG